MQIYRRSWAWSRHKQPTQLNNCHAAYQWALDHAAELNIDPDCIILSGYSIGAMMALGLAFRLKRSFFALETVVVGEVEHVADEVEELDAAHVVVQVGVVQDVGELALADLGVLRNRAPVDGHGADVGLHDADRALDCDGLAGSLNGYFGRVIEPGRVYELGYERCTCPKVLSGQIADPDQCNCSRQSILYILGRLEPSSDFEVEIMETVLRGAERCRFRITKK